MKIVVRTIMRVFSTMILMIRSFLALVMLLTFTLVLLSVLSGHSDLVLEAILLLRALLTALGI